MTCCNVENDTACRSQRQDTSMKTHLWALLTWVPLPQAAPAAAPAELLPASGPLSAGWVPLYTPRHVHLHTQDRELCRMSSIISSTSCVCGAHKNLISYHSSSRAQETSPQAQWASQDPPCPLSWRNPSDRRLDGYGLRQSAAFTVADPATGQADPADPIAKTQVNSLRDVVGDANLSAPLSSVQKCRLGKRDALRSSSH